MDGTLIAFRLATYDKDRASELVKRLVGQRTSIHGGTYVVRRKGLLDEIPPVRLIRGRGNPGLVRSQTRSDATRLPTGAGRTPARWFL